MAEAHAGSGKVTLFHQEAPSQLPNSARKHQVTYRIPALLFLPEESIFLAFAERRFSPRDEHAKHLVMRRGRKEGMSVQWGPQEYLMTIILPDHRTMNPCPVYEKKNGRIFLFFICVQGDVTESQQLKSGRNAAKLCYVSSHDGGHKWSPLTDLTHEVIGDDLKNWATFAVGPGHGLQTSSGRLVIPAYAYYIRRNCLNPLAATCSRPHSFIFFSDDYGQNWARGELLKSLRTGECQVAEVIRQDNRCVLYCNARSPDGYRIVAFSKDCGSHFEEPFQEMPETGNGCQGSVVSFTPVRKSVELGPKDNIAVMTPFLGSHHSNAPNATRSWMLFSHPTSRQKRVNLGIYLSTSPLAKYSWKAPWVLYEGPSGYSDLAVCEEGQAVLFGCLFECGVSNEYEEIAFQLFTDMDLLRNVKEG
ncbi:sialidase-3-like [Heteronotia binoei]|uniref:sialidase-3-like n=1 Tax=Heteronotia binoei TaxID=13085 RepID=UPI00292F4C0B|nr:sialidase-3-like [Heteronotia binoei]